MNAPLQKPNTENYFIFYGLKAVFPLEVSQLKDLFLEMSKQYHPDFYAGDSEFHHLAVSVSAYNNLAYKTLKNPISRASHLLDIHNSDIAEKIVLPNEFLMEMMDLNESIDEKNSDTQYQLEDTITELKSDLSKSIEAFAVQEDWANLRMEVLKWRYLERLEQRL